ncbi:MAG: PAS domain S-box protein, partial [Spirochaetota bacterium]
LLRLVAEEGIGTDASALRARFEEGRTVACCERAASSMSSLVIPDTKTECHDCFLANTYVDAAALISTLRHEDHDYGIIVVSLPSSMAADVEEQALFNEVVANIGFALHSLEGEASLDRTERLYSSTFRASPSAIGISRLRDGIFLEVNEAFLRLYGYGRSEVLGHSSDELRLSDSLARGGMIDELREKRRLENVELTGRRKNGDRFDALASLELTELGGEDCILGSLTDITERNRGEALISQALREKEILLRELYHRTRNNMLTIIGMMSLRASTHPETPLGEFVEDISQRIMALSLVHQGLYNQKDLSRIDLGDYLGALVGFVRKDPRIEDRIGFALDVVDVPVLIDTAMPIAIVVNELLTNALQHAFPGERRGNIRIGLARTERGEIELSIADDGVGAAPDFYPRGNSTFGLGLVFPIIEQQMKGRISWQNEGGMRYLISFRDDVYKERV